ncbi:SDR family oxidoreductase [Nocardioides xinjiangensis]|uniref:SDR family oxidoreductase n=1 Tax=Nocardioides xinjiangensis TaxID=2817376 RepID=UPI001FED5AE6|nr:SDR family oxidoreductase [Nocardioides sp. SYSU D00778]
MSEPTVPGPALKIAVAGGTGTVGRHVVEDARRRGHEVVVLSRTSGVDLVAGTGLDEALRGVGVVVDVSSQASRRSEESRRFFGSVTRNLLAAEERAGAGHHVALSIVGIDRAPHGYYAGKVLQEELVRRSRVPWTILRATQFHEFAGQVHGAISVGPLVLVPRMVSEPVAAAEVAARLVDLAEGAPAGRVADLGGPRRERMVDMVRAWARATGRPGRVVGVPLPGALGRAMRDGTLVTGPGADHGSTTFAAWLQQVR